MRQQPSQIIRQPIGFNPTSNTQVNVERLPDPESLKTMELCHREEPLRMPGWESRTLFWLSGAALAGSICGSLCLAAPALLLRCWEAMNTVDGLPVVGMMLGGMMSLIALLCLVFAPSAARKALGVFAIPSVAASIAAWRGYEQAVGGVLFVVSVATVILWRRSVMRFHKEWLLADPRVDRKNLQQFNLGNAGWTFPSMDDVNGMLDRYLDYDAPCSGAAGVWIAPSSQSVRVCLMALFAGSILAFFAVTASTVPLGYQRLAASVCGSALSLLVAILWTTGKTAAMRKKQEQLLLADKRSSWEQNSERVSRSEHVSIDPTSKTPVYESDHLFLGFEPWQKFPVLVHRGIVGEHAYFVGRTGSGKTSMGMMQFLIRLVRGNWQPAKYAWSEKSPVVIIDLKGDDVLFQTAMAEAKKRGQKFRFFTLEPGKATFRFNPFSGFRSSTLTIPQLVQLCLDALNLNHGSGYGRGYYSQRSRLCLAETIKAAPNVNSFKELYDTLRKLYAKQPEYRDAFELLSVIESLTHYSELVTTQQDDNDPNADTIRMDRVLEDREVVYFWLPAAKESAAVSTIGKLVLFNLQTAAYDRQAQSQEKRQMYLLIDEFQKLAGENFQQILQQARSSGVAVILANQSLGDLKTPDWDLGPAIRTNTNLKMFYSMNDPEDLKMMAELSGEEIQVYGAEDSESIRARLSVQELLAISDHPKRLLLQVSGGRGFTQFGGVPIPVETDWPISLELAEQRANLPWPSTPLRPIIVKPNAPASRVAATTKTASAPQPKTPQQPKMNPSVAKPNVVAPPPVVKSPTPALAAARPSATSPAVPPIPTPVLVSAAPIPKSASPSSPAPAALPSVLQPPTQTPVTQTPAAGPPPAHPATAPTSSPLPNAPQAAQPKAKQSAKGRKSAKPQPATKPPKASPPAGSNPNYTNTIQNLMEE